MFERKAMGKKIVVIFLFFLENSITLDSQEHIFYIYIYIQNRKVDLSTRQDNLIPRRKERRHLLDFECCSCPICKKVDVSTSLFSIVKANLWKYIYIKEKIVDQWKIDRGEVIIELWNEAFLWDVIKIKRIEKWLIYLIRCYLK